MTMMQIVLMIIVVQKKNKLHLSLVTIVMRVLQRKYRQILMSAQLTQISTHIVAQSSHHTPLHPSRSFKRRRKTGMVMMKLNQCN